MIHRVKGFGIVTFGNWQKVQSKPLLLSSLILTNPQNPLRQYVSILSWFHAVIQILRIINENIMSTLTMKLEQLNK